MVVFVKFDGDKRNKHFSKFTLKYFHRRKIFDVDLLQLLLETQLTLPAPQTLPERG